MKRVKPWVIFTLISIIIIAIIIRLIKLYEFAIWGSDSGEHYFLINQLVDIGYIDLDYNGWGLAYPYFPGMQLLTSGFTELSGVSTYHSLIFITPITAALSIILIFCISYRVFRDRRIGLVAAGFLAVVLPHVFSSSHPMPGSLGGFLLLTCILLLLKSYDNKKFIIPLGITTSVLVLTHHMSTYFLIITMVAIIIFRELFQKNSEIKETWVDRTWLDLSYMTYLVSISLVYWLFHAQPFYERILSKGIPLPTWMIFIFAYLAIFFIWFIIFLRRKWSWRFSPRKISVKFLIIRILLFNILGTIILFIAVVIGVPGTNMQTDIISIPLFLPIVFLMSFMSTAPAFLIHYRDGLVIFGWMFAILLSLIFAFITNSQELLLYRHLPYIFEPITILAGLGIVKLYDAWINRADSTVVLLKPNSEISINYSNDKSTLKKPSKMHSKKSLLNTISQPTRPNSNLISNLTAASLITILIIICGIYSYPPIKVVSGFEEGTTQEELETCFWIRENLPDGSTIASDHRMSSMVFGFSGINASWEYAPKTLHGESYDEIKDEVESVNVPSGKKRIDYILITDAIKDGVALEQWENADAMSNKAIDKFDSKPFIKLFDNGQAQIYYYVESNGIKF